MKKITSMFHMLIPITYFDNTIFRKNELMPNRILKESPLWIDIRNYELIYVTIPLNKLYRYIAGIRYTKI